MVYRRNHLHSSATGRKLIANQAFALLGYLDA